MLLYIAEQLKDMKYASHIEQLKNPAKSFHIINSEKLKNKKNLTNKQKTPKNPKQTNPTTLRCLHLILLFINSSSHQIRSLHLLPNLSFKSSSRHSGHLSRRKL